MLGLSTLAELRLALYGVVLAALGGWLIYEKHHLIAEGEARVKAADTAARANQKTEDEKLSAGVVNDLNQKLAALPVVTPPPRLRLCDSPDKLPARSPSKGTQPAVASSAGESSPGVSTGNAGLDIGPAVQDSKRAAEVIALYRDELWDWSVKQAR